MAKSVVAFGLFLAVAASSAAALAADVPISEEARSHFTAGVTFLQDPDGARYEEALREFQAAYAISPSWKILGNLGLAAMKLERDGEARDAIKRYLAEGGSQIEPDERAQMERDLQSLEASVVTVHLDATPAGASIVDERQPLTGNPVVNRYGPLQEPLDLGVRAGHHKFTAKLDGYADQVWELEGKPRGSGQHSFALTPVSAPGAAAPATGSSTSTSVDTAATSGNGLRIGSYVALGVGIVGLGAGTFFALSAKGKYDEANDLCPGSACTLHQSEANRRTQLGKDGDSAKTISLVGFIVGGVGVAAGATLFVLSRKPRESTAAQTSAYIGLGSVGVQGSF